jgi:hypothetical protein
MSGMAVKLSPEQVANARIIASVARRLGVDPVLAVATAWQESGLKNSATGDNGSSFGLFQLHAGGELGSHSAGWARNPTNNALTALRVFQQVQHQGRLAGGQLAAAAQRPADQAAYAQAVNAGMVRAKQILHLVGVRAGASMMPAKGGKQTGAGGGFLALLQQNGIQIPRGASALGASPAQILQALAGQTPQAQQASVMPASPDLSQMLTPSGQTTQGLTAGLDATRRSLLRA